MCLDMIQMYILQVRELCLQLLKEYPTQRVVITTLHTLTQLAAHCLVDIPQQVCRNSSVVIFILYIINNFVCIYCVED